MDWPGAEEHYLRALELAPNAAEVARAGRTSSTPRADTRGIGIPCRLSCSGCSSLAVWCSLSVAPGRWRPGHSGLLRASGQPDGVAHAFQSPSPWLSTEGCMGPSLSTIMDLVGPYADRISGPREVRPPGLRLPPCHPEMSERDPTRRQSFRSSHRRLGARPVWRDPNGAKVTPGGPAMCGPRNLDAVKS